MTVIDTALPPPYAGPSSPHGVQPTPEVRRLVHSQVMALLHASPAYAQLEPARQQQIANDLIKIGNYDASLMHDIFKQSKALGQTPMVLSQASEPPPPADEFSPRAVSSVARITQRTLNAIAFPTFVADLIKGTFQAIVNASIQQMEAYGNLLANVAKTVDQFMADNITDNQARDWLAQRYPAHFQIDLSDNAARVKARETDQPKPNFKTDLGLQEDVDISDETAEETLVPAARRKLAEGRHQMLSTMVLMGINRIVVTSGRVRAQMVFRINAQDSGQAHSATEFDEKNETHLSYGGGLAGWLGGPSGEMTNTLTYVSSTRKDSSDEVDVNASLTGEVDLHFKSDYFPMERFANPQLMAMIQGNTANPAANAPVTQGAAAKPAQPTQ